MRFRNFNFFYFDYTFIFLSHFASIWLAIGKNTSIGSIYKIYINGFFCQTFFSFSEKMQIVPFYKIKNIDCEKNNWKWLLLFGFILTINHLLIIILCNYYICSKKNYMRILDARNGAQNCVEVVMEGELLVTYAHPRIFYSRRLTLPSIYMTYTGWRVLFSQIFTRIIG